MKSTWRVASWIPVCVCLLACGGAPPPPAASACTLPTQVRLEASDRINPDSNGQALPTVVRVYQLKDIVRVEESDFPAIWEKAQETLGESLVQVQEFTLFPGQAQNVDVEVGPDTRYLVGVAIFRRPTGTQWRSITPLPASEKLCAAYSDKGAPSPALTFRFDQYRIESRSFLLTSGGEHDLPTDVAPDRVEKKGDK